MSQSLLSLAAINKKVLSPVRWGLALCLLCLLSACREEPNNYPHGKHSANNNIFFSSFSEQPKTLDPAKSYSADEAIFTGQIYEPPLEYNYLARPYQLQPLTLAAMPTITFFDADHHLLHNAVDPKKIAYSVYTLKLKKGIYYQPHVAFKEKRELVAEDYVYEIKRLAAPWLSSPIYSMMTKYIVGLSALHDELLKSKNKDLRQYSLSGVKQIDRYTYQITVKGYYPQFIYWLAMSFFAPVPWEVEPYNLSWNPVGTGPYSLTTNDPNREFVLTKNPNYHDDRFQTVTSGSFKVLSGKKLPFVDQFIFKLEKESIPRWHKFLQGYYDESGIGTEQFQQAINFSADNKPMLSPMLTKKGIHLLIATQPSVFFYSFNMKDKLVGGYSVKARKLRQAITLAIDVEEYITLFLNGRGIPAQGPIPPEIFGFHSGREGMNAEVYNFVDNHYVRKPIMDAKQLMKEAGYENGIDPATGEPLIIRFNTISASGSDQRAQLDWLRKQFAKIGIHLDIEMTQYSRFQDKINKGDTQMFQWGWSADYPDPENFLFLFYGPNSKVKSGGENSANYENPEYDKLYELMQTMANTPARDAIIQKMVNIIRHDAVWPASFYQQIFDLSQSWVGPRKLHGIANNGLKYITVNGKLRAEKQKAWNRSYWQFPVLLVVIILLLIIPAKMQHRLKEHRPLPRIKDDD